MMSDAGNPMRRDAALLAAPLQHLRRLAAGMPPVVAMGFGFGRCDGATLEMHAPLALNVNDKGSAFGGSMTSLMTFCGWSLVMLELELAGLQADVFVADSEVRYRAPVYADLHARAVLGPDQAWEPFLETLRQRGRSRIHMRAEVLLPEGTAAATLAGRYVAIAKG